MRGTSLQASTSYGPYGSIHQQTGTSQTSYGYTGEQFHAGTGLLYLRARYYSPAVHAFTSRDPWAGDNLRPMTLHGYNYVYNSPVNFTDPSGLDAWWCNTPQCQLDASGHQFDPRDLTSWLYREMMHNLNDPRLLDIRSSTDAARTIMFMGFILNFCAPNPLIGSAVTGSGGVVYGSAGLMFYNLVADRKPWDFKHRIKSVLGEGITLCTDGNCQQNIEYSVPGNIHYGFVGLAGGFNRVIIQAGAGWAEMNDPFYNPNSVHYGGVEYDPDGRFYVEYRNGLGISINLGDDPVDHDAVQFGMMLYRRYGRALTLGQFRRELARSIHLFDTQTPSVEPVRSSYANEWPYWVGYFNPTEAEGAR